MLPASRFPLPAPRNTRSATDFVERFQAAVDPDIKPMRQARNVGLLGRLATDRPHVGKLCGAYDFTFGTQVGAFVHAGSGTPVYKYVTSTNSADLFVEGRNGFYENGQVTRDKRTPALYRTDLLVSHELSLPGRKRLRLELNVLNVFDQKTARGGRRPALRDGGSVRARAPRLCDGQVPVPGSEPAVAAGVDVRHDSRGRESGPSFLSGGSEARVRQSHREESGWTRPYSDGKVQR